ncbi:MAG: lysoplasmalogenase [Candidatus Neomarinimicrobiota bacterium]|jgi:uncharacterized membrane protein YhhN
MKIELLTLFAAVSAVLAILFTLKKNIKMYSIFKPLTTIFIIIMAVIIFQNQGSDYSKIMLIALVFALVGDVFLISNKHFMEGMVFFFIAQIFFILSFSSIFGFNWNILLLVFFLIIGWGYFYFLKKDLKELSIPVFLYITVIVLMSWQAISLVFIDSSFTFISIGLASLFFLLSDAIIAYTIFKKDFRFSNIFILSTYWIAIYTFTLAGLYLN